MLYPRWERGDWLGLSLLAATLTSSVIPATSIGWTDDLVGFSLLPLIALLAGTALAVSDFPELIALLMSGVYGMGAVIGLYSMSVPSDASWSETLARRIALETARLLGGKPIEDPLILGLFLAALFWMLGHNAAWQMFRERKFWRAVLPPGITLLMFGVYGSDNASELLPVYAGAVVMLAVHSNAQERLLEWHLGGVVTPTWMRTWLLGIGTMVSLCLLALAWTLPDPEPGLKIAEWRRYWENVPWRDAAGEIWTRLFSSLEVEMEPVVEYYAADVLEVGGPVGLSGEVIWLVETDNPDPMYWRARVFASYDGRSWRSVSDATIENVLPNTPLLFNLPPASRTVWQSFRLSAERASLIYAAGTPIVLNLSVNVELDTVGGLPEVMSLRTGMVLHSGDRYEVISVVPSANADELRAAGTDYPPGIASRYLQLPPTVTDRTRATARQIASDAEGNSPYDMAIAVEEWLRGHITYNESVDVPPPDVDVVDWVLFERPEGYCTHYASAMAVLMRSLGVPTRVAAGFAAGEWDMSIGAYRVRERDAHAWPEVYFPGYGWVPFEPTATRIPLMRPRELPAVTPTITSSPTPTGVALEPMVQEEPLPVPSPSPTVTVERLPVLPQSGNGVRLPGWLIWLTMAVVVPVAVGWGVWWTLEERGLGGLDPVGKVYGRMCAYAARMGMHIPPSATPDERRRLLSDAVPEAGKAIYRVVELYIREVYGPPSGADASHFAREARLAWMSARWMFRRRWLLRLFSIDRVARFLRRI